MMALVAALVISAADPCAPVEPAARPDPAAAAAYRAVAEAERGAGSPETAIVAYRGAVALDPSDQVSRRALAGLCAAAPARPRAAFDRGVALLEGGDPRGAARAFEEARASGSDPSAALLEGVCRYELGEDRAARALLREAEAAPEHRETASLYLGLIALRDGDAAEAARLLDVAAESRALAPAAIDLARLARSRQRLFLSLLAEAGWDSNAQLAPTEIPVSSSWDATFGLTAAGIYRPLGESGPYLSGTALYRQQARFGDLDYGGASAAAGWQLGDVRRGLLAEYAFDDRVLGGHSFLTAHRLLASGWLPAGGASLGASYLARFESYPDPFYAPFSGTFQRADATASVPLGTRTTVTLAYRLLRDGVEQPQLSFTEHGPALELRHALAPRVHVGAGAAVSWRRYDALDPLLGVTRSDTYLDAFALVEWDVASRWTVRFSVDARDALSNATGFAYLRVAPTLGLAYAVGL